MPRRTLQIAFACGVLASGTAVAATPGPTAAAQIHAFAVAPAGSFRVTPAGRSVFTRTWAAPGANGKSVLATLVLSRMRTFTLRPDLLSVVAAPTKTGGVCFVDSLLGGACFKSFAHGTGMIQGFPQLGGSTRTRITGIVPDGVSAVRFRAASGQKLRATVRHNVFELVAPASLHARITSFAYIGANGKAGAEQSFG